MTRWAATKWTDDPHLAAQYAEEWDALVSNGPGKILKFIIALQFVVRGLYKSGVRARARRRQKPSPNKKTQTSLPPADATELSAAIMAIRGARSEVRAILRLQQSRRLYLLSWIVLMVVMILPIAVSLEGDRVLGLILLGTALVITLTTAMKLYVTTKSIKRRERLYKEARHFAGLQPTMRPRDRRPRPTKEKDSV